MDQGHEARPNEQILDRHSSSGSEDNDSSETETIGSRNHEHVDDDQRSGDTVHRVDFQDLRWQKLKPSYNDQYLDLFHASYSKPLAGAENLSDSQLGSVSWSGLEKENLFNALARKGRHNLPAIAQAVHTKSILEVKEFLNLVQNAERKRQMFSKHPKNITHADLEAAVEVDEDTEQMLESMADALSAFQDNFDRIAAQRSNDQGWLIDTVAASALDVQAENVISSGDEYEAVLEPAMLFDTSKFLELSRKLYMNLPFGQEDWTTLAESGQEPSMTTEVIEDFYDLVSSFVQRVLQTAVFLANSRHRSTATEYYVPSLTLKASDVSAALSVLNLPEDSWDYWTKFPRRSGLNVALDTSRSSKKHLTLQEVEDALSVRASRGRRRSLSSLVSMSPSPSPSVFATELVHSITEVDQPCSDSRLDSEVDSVSDEGNSLISESESHVELSEKKHISRNERGFQLEKQQDAYLEQLDQVSSAAEVARIRGFLGEPKIKSESVAPLPRRPLTKRKAKDDLGDWTLVRYLAAWERNQNDTPTVNSMNYSG